MAAVLRLAQDARHMSDLPAVLNEDPWATASEAARTVAQWREALVSPLADLVHGGASINHAVALLKAQLDAGTADLRSKHAASILGGKGLSVPNLKRWLSAYLKGDKAALLPQYAGRQRQAYGWEERAVGCVGCRAACCWSATSWRRARWHSERW